MKRILLTLTVLGSLLLGACEKEELSVPEDKTLIKVDKGIMCRGCGQWDFDNPGDGGVEATALRTVTSVDTIATPTKKVNSGKGRK